MESTSGMASSRISNPVAQRIEHPADTSEQGFALVTLIALVPLCAAAVVALCSGLYILKRKSLAQSHCVQQASQTQNELKETLERLLRLNPQAKTLRAKRQAADEGLKAALSSANPYAIAAAQAYWSAVVLQQTALRARQQALLSRAEVQRRSGYRKLRERIRSLSTSATEARRYYWRPLAVEANPPATLTPDYEPIPLFSTLQQQRFKFLIELKPPFARSLSSAGIKQIAECSVTLEEKENKWKLKILAANAPSSWLSF